MVEIFIYIKHRKLWSNHVTRRENAKYPIPKQNQYQLTPRCDIICPKKSSKKGVVVRIEIQRKKKLDQTSWWVKPQWQTSKDSRGRFFEKPQGKKKNKKAARLCGWGVESLKTMFKKKKKLEDAVDAVYAVAREPRRGFSSSRLRSRRSFETNRHCSPSILNVRICDWLKLGTKSDLPDPRRVAVKVSSRGCVG